MILIPRHLGMTVQGFKQKVCPHMNCGMMSYVVQEVTLLIGDDEIGEGLSAVTAVHTSEKERSEEYLKRDC